MRGGHCSCFWKQLPFAQSRRTYRVEPGPERSGGSSLAALAAYISCVGFQATPFRQFQEIAPRDPCLDSHCPWALRQETRFRAGFEVQWMTFVQISMWLGSNYSKWNLLHELWCEAIYTQESWQRCLSGGLWTFWKATFRQWTVRDCLAGHKKLLCQMWILFYIHRRVSSKLPAMALLGEPYPQPERQDFSAPLRYVPSAAAHASHRTRRNEETRPCQLRVNAVPNAAGSAILDWGCRSIVCWNTLKLYLCKRLQIDADSLPEVCSAKALAGAGSDENHRYSLWPPPSRESAASTFRGSALCWAALCSVLRLELQQGGHTDLDETQWTGIYDIIEQSIRCMSMVAKCCKPPQTAILTWFIWFQQKSVPTPLLAWRNTAAFTINLLKKQKHLRRVDTRENLR